MCYLDEVFVAIKQYWRIRNETKKKTTTEKEKLYTIRFAGNKKREEETTQQFDCLVWVSVCAYVYIRVECVIELWIQHCHQPWTRHYDTFMLKLSNDTHWNMQRHSNSNIGHGYFPYWERLRLDSAEYYHCLSFRLMQMERPDFVIVSEFFLAIQPKHLHITWFNVSFATFKVLCVCICWADFISSFIFFKFIVLLQTCMW